MPRFHQGAVVKRRSSSPMAVLTGLIAVDKETKAWCYKEHVRGEHVTLASHGWLPFMENMNPIWQPLDAYWIGKIREFFPNIELRGEYH